MASDTSVDQEMVEQHSPSSMRTSDDEQYLSLECDERYDFRQTTKEKRKYSSPLKSERNSKGNTYENFEADSTENMPDSTTQGWGTPKLACDSGFMTVNSSCTPTTRASKRKNSFATGGSEEKKRKLISTHGNQSPMSEISTCNSTKNTSWVPQLTVVQPFSFMTDARIKNVQSKNNDKQFDFVSSLRRCSPRLNQEYKPKLTKPKPFSFDVEVKHGQKQQVPDQESVNQETSKEKTHLVIPQSPKLRAVTRHRQVTALSREQIEEMEVEEMKKWKFHAKPVNSKLFAQTGIVKVEPKPTTKPEGIQLETQRRFQEKPKSSKGSPVKYEFHAQPIPKDIFKGPRGLKRKIQLPLTAPKSPQFSNRTRKQRTEDKSLMEVSMSTQQKVKKLPSKLRKRPPAPMPEKLSTFERKCTEIQPFSFEEKDRVRFEKKKAKIEQELVKVKMVHEFKANPMPIPGNSPSGVPVVPKKSPTKPKPFKLRVEQLAERKTQKLKQVENELCSQMKGTAFKANPATVIQKPAFQPLKSTKPLTEINGFQLHTDKRAAEWHEMAEEIKARNAEYEVVRERLNKEKVQKEKEELALLRQQAVHKANPIKQFKPTLIKESEKPLTEPISPKFATSKRAHRV